MLSLFYCCAQKEKQHVERTLMEVRQKEDQMSQSNQSLITRLEDVQVQAVLNNRLTPWFCTLRS